MTKQEQVDHLPEGLYPDGFTGLDLVRKYFPDADDAQVQFIMWEFTKFPFFWHYLHAHPAINFEGQLNEVYHRKLPDEGLEEFINRYSGEVHDEINRVMTEIREREMQEEKHADYQAPSAGVGSDPGTEPGSQRDDREGHLGSDRDLGEAGEPGSPRVQAEGSDPGSERGSAEEHQVQEAQGAGRPGLASEQAWKTVPPGLEARLRPNTNWTEKNTKRVHHVIGIQSSIPGFDVEPDVVHSPLGSKKHLKTPLTEFLENFRQLPSSGDGA